jgi:hypothetical protein
MKKFLIIYMLVLLVANAFAQPQKFGCDYYRNLGPKRAPITEFQRKLLNESIARSDTFDIVHYDISIDVTDYNGQQISAFTNVTYSPKMENQTYIRFDLMQLIVDSVTGENVASFEHTGEHLDITFIDSPMMGEVYDLTVHYHGNPYRDPYWGGFYFASNYIYNLGIGLTTIPPNFGRVWYPCFDSFVERATYAYHVKSAGTFRAWCQGEFINEEILGGDTVVRNFNFDQPIPTHLSAIAVADYQNYEYVHTGAFGDIPVSLRAKPANMPAMQNVFQNLGYAIDALEYWFGPHGWSRVGYVLTTDGALEIPTNIAYPQFMVTESVANNDGLLSHELGHHWWGDMVTPHIHNDMWMKEGPAEYSSHLMVEWMSGTEAFVDRVKDNQLYVLQNAHVEDEGFHPLSPIPDEHIYGRHTYYKGASIIHNLRGYMGDDLFRVGMTAVQANHAYQDLTPQQLKVALEDATGLDLDPYFDYQIYLPGFATFVVDSFAAVNDGNQWNTQVYIQQKLRACPAFHENVPLDITIIDSQNQRQNFEVNLSGEFSTVNLTSDVEPYMIVLNGFNRLNQNRMDHEEWIVPDGGFSSNLPYVDFRVYDDVVTDSTLMRVEHIWSAPDDENLGEGIFEMSATHYWTVDGIWPESSQLSGRVNYRAVDINDLDYDLYGNTEADAVVVYRPNASEPWRVYSDFTITAGNLFNGAGNIKLDILRKGHYAFANGDPSVAIDILDEIESDQLIVYPVPATEHLHVGRASLEELPCLLEIFDVSGRMVMKSSAFLSQTSNKTLDISELESGNYVIRACSLQGEVIAQKKFIVAR